MTPPRSILLLGNTAEGALLGGYFQSRGFSPLLLGRKRAGQPFTRLEAGGKEITLEVKALPQSEIFHVQAAFATVKSFDLLGIIERHIHYLPPKIPIFCLAHSGIEKALAQFASQHPQFWWRLGTCEHHLQELIPSFFRHTAAAEVPQGQLTWGPLFSEPLALHEEGVPDPMFIHTPTGIEQEWLAQDPYFFQWHGRILEERRIQWLYELVIASLSAAMQLPTCGALFSHMEVLGQTFEEGYQLGLERWKTWPLSRDKLYEGLISQISKRASQPNLMYLDTLRQQKTENQYFAGSAGEKYPQLWALALKIAALPHGNHMGG